MKTLICISEGVLQWSLALSTIAFVIAFIWVMRVTKKDVEIKTSHYQIPGKQQP